MAMVDPRAMRGAQQDFSRFDELNLEEAGLVGPGDYLGIIMFGMEKPDDNNVLSWRFKVGLEINGPQGSQAGHWWVGAKANAPLRWNNLIAALAPEVLESDKPVELNPLMFVGRKIGFRASYGKGQGSENRLFVDRYFYIDPRTGQPGAPQRQQRAQNGGGQGGQGQGYGQTYGGGGGGRGGYGGGQQQQGGGFQGGGQQQRPTQQPVGQAGFSGYQQNQGFQGQQQGGGGFQGGAPQGGGFQGGGGQQGYPQQGPGPMQQAMGVADEDLPF